MTFFENFTSWFNRLLYFPDMKILLTWCIIIVIIFDNWSKLCLSATLISLTLDWKNAITHLFGVIDVILNRYIMHLFLSGINVLVWCGDIILVVQTFFTITGEFDMFRSQALSRSWSLNSSYTKRGIVYSKVLFKNRNSMAKLFPCGLNISYCWNYYFNSFWIV